LVSEEPGAGELDVGDVSGGGLVAGASHHGRGDVDGDHAMAVGCDDDRELAGAGT
jgi:hypothetical protein